MFHILTTLLAAATLLAHSILGCCWHSHASCGEGHACCAAVTHRHTGDEEPGERHAAGMHSHLHWMLGEHHHTAACDEEHPAPAQPGESTCEHGECTFVTAKAVAINLDLVVAGFAALSVENGDSHAATQAVRRGVWKEPDRGLEDSRGRARAALQVWQV